MKRLFLLCAFIPSLLLAQERNHGFNRYLLNPYNGEAIFNDDVVFNADIFTNLSSTEVTRFVAPGGDTIVVGPAGFSGTNSYAAGPLAFLMKDGATIGVAIDTTFKFGLGTATPDKLFGLSDGIDEYSISVAGDKLTFWDDAATPDTLYSIDSLGVIYRNSDRFLSAYGTRNLFLGVNAGNLSLTGYDNSAIGLRALRSVTTGFSNAAFGTYALNAVTSGSNNTALGFGALQVVTTANDNVAVGSQSMYKNTTGYENTAVGLAAMYENTTGVGNSAFGDEALRLNSTGGLNTAVGMYALFANTTADSNVAVGFSALDGNTTGRGNVAVGYFSGDANITGYHNTFIGALAGATSTNGLNNATAVGYNAQVTASNSLVLGNGANVGINDTAPVAVVTIKNATPTFAIYDSDIEKTHATFVTIDSAMFGIDVSTANPSMKLLNSSGAVRFSVVSDGHLSITGGAYYTWGDNTSFIRGNTGYLEMFVNNLVGLRIDGLNAGFGDASPVANVTIKNPAPTFAIYDSDIETTHATFATIDSSAVTIDGNGLQVYDEAGRKSALQHDGTDAEVHYLRMINTDGEICYVYPNATQDGIVVSATKP